MKTIKLWCLQRLQIAVPIIIDACTFTVRVCNRVVGLAQKLDVWVDEQLLAVRFNKKPLTKDDTQ